jgi:hypothetical protein
MATDEPLPDRCSAETRSGGYCENYPVGGAERCRMHGGTAAEKNAGADNGNFEHGAYSEHFKSDLSDREQEAFGDLVDALADESRTQDVLREAAAELFLKYKRSGDPRFLREARQLLSEFNVVDATDHHEHEFDLSMSSDEKAQLNDLLDRDPQE